MTRITQQEVASENAAARTVEHPAHISSLLAAGFADNGRDNSVSNSLANVLESGQTVRRVRAKAQEVATMGASAFSAEQAAIVPSLPVTLSVEPCALQHTPIRVALSKREIIGPCLTSNWISATGPMIHGKIPGRAISPPNV